MNKITKIIKSHLAIVADTSAKKPNPKTAAMTAITKKAIAHDNNPIVKY
jgi:hypothetical protein